MYQISDYSFNRAKDLGVIIKPSKKKNKKIDVYNEDGTYITSIGNINYDDFPTHLKKKGLYFALQRRQAYISRHACALKKKGSTGFYACSILW